MQKILLIVMSLFITDSVSIKIAKKIDKSINIKNNQNIRWFFIHCISNLFVTINAIPDLLVCLLDPYNIYKYQWNNYSYNTFYISVITHIYHISFFNITPADRLHHGLMVLIAGSIEYYNKSIISSAALFFISGLPGCIDYFLLFLVKLNKISKKREKIIYLYLSAYIRSPGACIISVMGLYNLKREFNNYSNNILNNYSNNILNNNSNNILNSIISLLSCILVFWNGQYYLMLSSIDYGKFIEKNKYIA